MVLHDGVGQALEHIEVHTMILPRLLEPDVGQALERVVVDMTAGAAICICAGRGSQPGWGKKAASHEGNEHTREAQALSLLAAGLPLARARQLSRATPSQSATMTPRDEPPSETLGNPHARAQRHERSNSYVQAVAPSLAEVRGQSTTRE